MLPIRLCKKSVNEKATTQDLNEHQMERLFFVKIQNNTVFIITS